MSFVAYHGRKRHCDNLLMQATGEIFHIDFGCSFGRDFGMAQDIPFTLTTQMTAVLGESFRSWEDLTTAAFLALRPHRSALMCLGMAALGGRLPHVQRVSDLRIM